MPTTTQDYQFFDGQPRVLAVKANGGSVSVQVYVGSSWVESDVYTFDTAAVMQLGKSRVRIVPSGGAEFELS